ncbi:MAG TPA: transporter substrate-binding domain-containing protein [Opitutus sp.]|nr:transporter substrate-binding domain-containing protein [Opitutus sp.]
MNAHRTAAVLLRRCRAALAIGGVFLAGLATAAPRVWRTGWYPQPPLQFLDLRGEVEIVTGLDVQVMRAVARQAGRQLRLEEVPWDEQQEQLRNGQCDVAFGATWTAEREKYARFSAPYRREENALYFRVGDLRRYKFKDPAGFLALVRADRLRLGVVKGTAYLLPEVEAFVRDPANARHVLASDTDAGNLQALANGEVDAALAERLAAATITTQLGFDTTLAEHPVPFGGMDVRAMFSRASTTEADVAAFNRGLQAVQVSGEFDRILRGYLLPPLLEIAVGGRWFFWLDLVGTAAFALSGVILAQRGRYNLIGAFVLAALPAVGGGLLRDLVTGRRPVGVLRSPVPLLLVAGLVVAGYVFFKLTNRGAAGAERRHGKMAGAFDALCGFFDTVGLAAFVVTGVRVAVDTNCEPLWLWGPLLAILTGAGGGILRDIVRADAHNRTLKRGFYAEVALVWGLVFSLFLEWEVRGIGLDQVRRGTLVVLAGAFLTRLLIQWRDWPNPFQFGHPLAQPERRLADLANRARALVAGFPAWFEEQSGAAWPWAPVEIEKLHTAAGRELAALRAGARELAAEPVPAELTVSTAALQRGIDRLVAMEKTLYDIVCEPTFVAESAQRLQETIHAGVVTLAQAAVESGRATSAAVAPGRAHRTALETVRARLAAAGADGAAGERARMPQLAAKFERLAQLLVEFGADEVFAPPRAAAAVALASRPRAPRWPAQAAAENSIAGADAPPE